MLNHHNSTTWVVVADAAQAKFYRMVKFPKIEEISNMRHPESRLHNQELTGAQPGRGYQRGGGISFTYESELEPKQIEADKFAAQVSEMLTKGIEQGEFQRLYLFAGPAFLGMLRRHLSPNVRKAIVAEINKELTSIDHTAIEKHIANL